jgi:hypothetical protein
MRQKTGDEQKLLDIMNKYGSARVHVDSGGIEGCSFEGNIRAKGNTWMYIGYGADVRYDGAEPFTPIDETYLALNEVMWNSVKKLSRE